VLDNLSRDPLHVGGFQGKHIEVRFEEVDERAFLFRIEPRPDTERTTVIRDNCILDILGELERAGCSLGRLEDILVLGRGLGVEPLGPDQYLRKLVEVFMDDFSVYRKTFMDCSTNLDKVLTRCVEVDLVLN
jgi:hypothetical protein